MADFSKFAEAVIKLNDKNGHWDQTQRQARSVSSLFVKFMIEDQQVHDLRAIAAAPTMANARGTADRPPGSLTSGG